MIEQYHRPDLRERDHHSEDVEDARACPVCHRIDATSKASSVARANRGRFVLDDGTSAAYESELGGLLGRPERPELLSVGIIVTAFVVGWALAALTLIVVGLLRAQDYVALPETALETAKSTGLIWFGLVIPGAAVARYFLRREAVRRQMPSWRDASQRWQAFHYCSRDDVVFVPGEGHGVAPEHIAVLYRQAQPAPVITLRQQEAQA